MPNTTDGSGLLRLAEQLGQGSEICRGRDHRDAQRIAAAQRRGEERGQLRPLCRPHGHGSVAATRTAGAMGGSTRWRRSRSLRGCATWAGGPSRSGSTVASTRSQGVSGMPRTRRSSGSGRSWFCSRAVRPAGTGRDSAGPRPGVDRRRAWLRRLTAVAHVPHRRSRAGPAGRGSGPRRRARLSRRPRGVCVSVGIALGSRAQLIA
jgi:hypothetical protein